MVKKKLNYKLFNSWEGFKQGGGQFGLINVIIQVAHAKRSNYFSSHFVQQTVLAMPSYWGGRIFSGDREQVTASGGDELLNK